MKVSFDKDGTLVHVHHLVERFQRFGDEVHIVTSRCEDRDQSELFAEAEELGIKRENVHFTNTQIKLPKLEELGISLHFDDDQVEIDEINRYSETCKGLLVNFKHDYSND